DEQIRSYLRQAETSGLSENEMERLALERGMPPAEIQKLRERIERLGGTSISQRTDSPLRNVERSVNDSLSRPVSTDSVLSDSSVRPQLKIFGASLFKGATPVFEPNLRIATPRSYVVGPGDQILIDIYGRSEENHTL